MGILELFKKENYINIDTELTIKKLNKEGYKIGNIFWQNQFLGEGWVEKLYENKIPVERSKYEISTNGIIYYREDLAKEVIDILNKKIIDLGYKDEINTLRLPTEEEIINAINIIGLKRFATAISEKANSDKIGISFLCEGGKCFETSYEMDSYIIKDVNFQKYEVILVRNIGEIYTI